jgi:uncharacterized membrane protein YgcG
MNKFTRFALVAATSLTLANVAFATSASPKQIAALVNQADQERANGQSEQATNDYEKARTMTQQVIHDHPGSAKAQYYLAQIDERLGKGEEAQQAIDQTQKLDPNKHFTNDPNRVNTLQHQVNQENSAAIEKSHTHIFLGVVFVIILAAIGFFVFNRRRKANALEADRKKYLGQLVQQNSDTMAMDKDLRYQSMQDSVLARDVKELMAAQVEAMTSLQNGSWDGSTSQFNTLARGFKDVSARYQAKNFDNRENESVSYMDSLKGVGSSNQSYSSQSSARPTYYDNSSNGSGYQTQGNGGGTTIINNTSNNNDGFFTGMMMGEMMSRPERETVIVERDRDSYRDRNDSYSNSSSYNDDDDERRRRSSNSSSSWDSGSSSSWDSSSSSSSSFDSGSGSDSSWSDSSFDSSSSSSDSSW